MEADMLGMFVFGMIGTFCAVLVVASVAGTSETPNKKVTKFWAGLG
jgi:hypothetical protein